MIIVQSTSPRDGRNQLLLMLTEHSAVPLLAVFFLWFFALPAAVSGIVLQRNAPIVWAGILLFSAGLIQTIHEIHILKSPQMNGSQP
jgi:ABC-type amino acid transport system permease subunit